MSLSDADAAARNRAWWDGGDEYQARHRELIGRPELRREATAWARCRPMEEIWKVRAWG